MKNKIINFKILLIVLCLYKIHVCVNYDINTICMSHFYLKFTHISNINIIACVFLK